MPDELNTQQQTELEKTQSQQQTEQNQNLKPEKKDVKPSIYEQLGEPDPGAKGSATWADDWREQLAIGDDGKVDEKQLNQLKRYATPKDYHKSILGIRQRISSGEYKRAVMPEGDEAALVEWRKENGIPEKPDDYEVPLPAGTDFDSLDEGTKESINGFRSAFHKANLAGPQAKVVTDTIVEIAEKQLEREANADAVAQETLEDGLRADWGSEYRQNLAMNWAHLQQAFGEESSQIIRARTPDGRRLVDLPSFNKYLNENARANGADVLIRSEDGGRASSVETRIGEIEKIMNTDYNRYLSENLGDEYGKLLAKQEARGKLKV